MTSFQSTLNEYSVERNKYKDIGTATSSYAAHSPDYDFK